MHQTRTALFLILAAVAGAANAAPVTYQIDSRHTYPSFEADHFGGVSVWRGKFTATTGTVVLDREAKAGTVDITVQADSVQTGLADLDKHLRGDDFFAVEKFPTATFKGKFAGFKEGAPTEVQGELTLRDVTRPVTFVLRSFKCVAHPMKKGTELCGADAHATIDREEFGMSYGKNFGFDMKVRLALQVEATASK